MTVVEAVQVVEDLNMIDFQQMLCAKYMPLDLGVAPEAGKVQIRTLFPLAPSHQHQTRLCSQVVAE